MKYLQITIIIWLLLALSSCDSFLDLEPKQSIETGEVLYNAENIKLTLIGAYPVIRNMYGANLFHCSDLLADNGEIDFRGTFPEPRDLLGKNMVASFAWGRDAWDRAYDGINRCNIVLDYIDVVDDSEKDNIRGQALFLRGLVYFDLVRFYAKPYRLGENNVQDGVPIVLESNFDITKIVYPSRATVDEVYERVITDLTTAKSLLEDDVFYASKYAVAAILSRVYLQQGMYEEAAEEANFVISNVRFELEEKPFLAFNRTVNGKEDVFAFQQNNDDNSGTVNGGMAAMYASTDATGRSDFHITETELNKYEENDRRGVVQTGLIEKKSLITDVNQIFYNGFGTSASDGIFCAKWLDFKTNLTFIRLAEMYLTRAEGNFESGNNIGADPLSDINKIRERAGLPLLSVLTRDVIRKERKLELAFEGFKLHDLKRWKEAIGDLPYDSPRLVLPIPKREDDVNDNLTQNEGY